jgi:phytoene synthase
MRFLGKKRLSEVPSEVMAHAEKVCASAGSNFTKSFKLMTPMQRQAMTLFYAFCREVDDWADEDELGSQQSRQSVLIAMKDELSGGPVMAKRSHWETVIGIGHLMEEFRIPPKHFMDLVDGMLMDCQSNYYRLWNDVLTYCYRVASTVGLVSVHFFSSHPERLLGYAIEQGLALQLVNIYRDFHEDLRRGRCYLPLEWLGVTPADMVSFLDLSEKARRRHDLYASLLQCRERIRIQAEDHFVRAMEQCPARERIKVWPLIVLGYSYINVLKDIPVKSFERPKANPWKALRDAVPEIARFSP